MGLFAHVDPSEAYRSNVGALPGRADASPSETFELTLKLRVSAALKSELAQSRFDEVIQLKCKLTLDTRHRLN